VNDSGNCVASMHPVQELVASADEDAEVPTDAVTVWRRSRRLLFGPPKWKSETFRLEGYEIRRIALSDDGNCVLTCLSSGEIGLLDCRANTFMIVGSHFGEVVCAFLASDPLRALTASADRTVKVWDGVNGCLLAEFQADRPIAACAASSGFSRVVAFDQGGTLINLRLVSPADSPAASASQVAGDAGPRVPRLVARTMDEVRAANLKGIEVEASGAVREACAWHRASFCGANRLLGYTHPWTQGAPRNLSDALLSLEPLEKIRKVESAARRIGSAERRRARAKSEEILRRYREMSMDVAHQILEVLRTVGQEGEVGFRVTGDVSMTARLKIAPERLQQGIEWVTDFPRELIGRGPIALAAVLGLMDDVPSLTKAVLLYDFLQDIVLPFGATPKSTMLAEGSGQRLWARPSLCEVRFARPERLVADRSAFHRSLGLGAVRGRDWISRRIGRMERVRRAPDHRRAGVCALARHVRPGARILPSTAGAVGEGAGPAGRVRMGLRSSDSRGSGRLASQRRFSIARRLGRVDTLRR